MNKIYKVVWSKVKHCYVVTSELAKRQTKGCGARSLRTATVSLSVAASLLCAGAVLPIFGESVAEAGSVGVVNKLIMGDGLEWNGSTTAVTITADTIDTINNNINADPRKHAYGNITYTYGSEKFNAIAERDVVSFKVVDGQLIECHDAPITVIQQYPSAMDGYDTNKDVSGYSITINNTSDKLLYAVYGGYSKEGNVSSNSATITNGTITNTVYGGYSGVSGNVENNNVTINGGTIGDLDNGSGAVYGAYTYNGLASNNTITINSGSTVRCPTAGSSYNGKVEENTLNINGGTIVEMAFGGVGNGTYVKSNTVNIKNDATVNATVYGGMVWGDSASDPTDVTGNTVNISDTANVNENVYGGYTYYGKVSNNTVNLNGGTVYKVYGGYTTGGAAETNHVVVNGGVVGITTSGGRTVFSGGKLNGAYSYNSSGNSGNVTGNTVTIDKGTVMADIYGGNTEAKNNKSGDAIKNIVTINGGTLAGDIYGGYSRGDGNPSGKVDGNEVKIAGGVLNKAKVEINGSNVETQGVRFIYGGYTYGNNGPSESTIAYKNAVTISGGTFNNNTEVTGGYSNLYNAELNTVNITKDFSSTVGDVIGGKSVYDTAKENTVTIAGGIVSNAYGGIGSVAEKNSVNITGGTVSGKVYGGHTDFGTAGGDTANDGNKVTISGGTVSNVVYGGYSQSGDAKFNSVTISGSGRADNTVYGGYSQSGVVNNNTVSISGGIADFGVTGGYSNTGAVTNNKVTITSGTVIDGIRGGNTYDNNNSGDVKYNAVSISGDAKIRGEGIIGGLSWNSDAIGNTVTISGGSFEPLDPTDPVFNSIPITAGATNRSTAKEEDNVVNITGEVTGLDTASITGYSYGNSNHSGNELHIGGTKTYDSNGTATVSGSDAWQGKSSDGTVNNKVKSVALFESIVLHNVKWSTTLPVLEATKITNVGTLDITNMQFDQTPSNGESMALLKAGNDLGASGAGIGLAYKDGSTEKTATSAELATGVTFDSGALTDTAVNGVSLTGTQSKKVSLENSNKEIRYAFSSAVTGITIATNTFTAGGMARAFGSGDNLTGATITNNLAFSPASKKNMASGTSMVILDATKAVAVSGATLPAFTAQTYKEKFDDPISGKVLTLSGTHTDTLALNTAKTQLVYTVGDKNVETAAFNGAVDFSTGDAYYKADSQYKFGKTNVDAQKLTFNETAEALTKGSSMTLLSATNITAGTVTQPDAPTVAIKYGGDATNGITFNATATGSVAVEESAVKYKVNTVEASKIDLSNWNGTPADVATATSGWTLKAGETIETGELAKADLSGLKADETKTILTASDTVVFTNDAITGKKKWKEDGTSIAETTHESGVVISAGETTASGVKVNESNAHQLIYHQGKNNVTAITLGEVTFNTAKAAREFGNAYDLTTADIDATNFTIKDAATTAMNAGEEMIVLDATDAIKKADGTALKVFTDEPGSIAVDFKDEKVDGKELAFEGTHKDTLSLNDKKTQVVYKVGEKEVNKATFTGEVAWNDSEAYYDAAKGTAKYTFGATDVDATNLKVTGKTDKALKKGDAMTLISATGLKAGKVTQPTDAGSIDMNYSEKGITLAGKVAGEVKAADNAIKYEVTGVNVNKADIGSVEWQEGASLVDFSDKANNFAGVTTIGTDKFAMTYAKPEEVAAKQSMTLLQANDSLKAIVNEEKAKTYSIEPVAGVTIDAKLTGKLANSGNNVTFTATENKASALTFEKVEWTGSNPLIDHSKTLKNVSFDGATVDTSNIDFYKEMYVEADQTTTLVSDFGGTPKDIKGTTYKVGTAFDGEGSATMENGNLIFRTKTSAGVSEQTHKAVMGVEATMGLLASGKEHVGNVLDGLGNLSNVGSDGASVAASFGGGKDRYETNSHVNINSWSAAVGVGARKETKKGTLQYGIFGEYGKGNYTMHSDVGRSDGDAHYAGGGLMAKWTNKHDVYTEASFRLGRVSDSANDLLRDGAGNAYGYDIHATYYGAHVGLGKIFNYKGGKSLDVYGKFFYTKRDGCEFDAKQHYNLDSVNSSVLRIGARYGTTDKKWNWYGGLAYEYEFDGEAKGTVNGTEIRAASIKGSSVRGEFGMRMDATKDNPWRTDISIYGYGGKHRGFGGSVNVAYTF